METGNMGKRTYAVQTESKMMAGGECLDIEASPSKEGVEGRKTGGRARAVGEAAKLYS